MMERIWTIIAGACLIVAAVLLLQDNMNAAFVVATLGVVAWFLRLRGPLRKALQDEANLRAAKEDNSSGDEDED
ncbi:MAG TPA: hypothetical protein VM911_11455 [Pyrinomonadaceae bacterium]|jgi:hypothetical protein|nr:hypothetical protein [Pyrinomonadaceae bacterium]